MSVAPPLPDAASVRVHRTPSASARHAAAQPAPGRPLAQSSANGQSAATARRDFEPAGAPPVHGEGRSASRDRSGAQYPTRSDSLRTGPSQGGGGGGSRERRYASIDATSSHAAPPANGMAADHRGVGVNPAPRKRTYVTCSTGTWILGKTIGQGSMGKVKLAKNQDTGEQVGFFLFL
jgi:hypothetical protein